MNKNYTVRIYDHTDGKWDETKETFTLRQARAEVNRLGKAINKKHGNANTKDFSIVIMKGDKFAFPKLNKDLLSITLK